MFGSKSTRVSLAGEKQKVTPVEKVCSRSVVFMGGSCVSESREGIAENAPGCRICRLFLFQCNKTNVLIDRVVLNSQNPKAEI